jgi:hypothetical protein
MAVSLSALRNGRALLPRNVIYDYYDIKMDLNEIELYVLTWRTMTQSRDQWRVLGNTGTKFCLAGTR